MRRMTFAATIFTAGLGILPIACSNGDDPLASIDKQYVTVMVDLGTAERDNARNVRNKEARQRKSKAEKARVAFFRNTKVESTIEHARSAPVGDPVRVKGDAYWRHLTMFRPWTENEKAEENRLLGRLEEARSMEATWTSPDGTVNVVLDQPWDEASLPADALDADARNSLAREYVQHRMRVVNSDLQDLIRLRNTVAQREGFSNYWELALASQGLDPQQVDAVSAELTDVVAPINGQVQTLLDETAKASGCTPEFANYPMLVRQSGLSAGHDEADRLFDADLAEERVMTAFQDMGVPTEGWQVYSGPQRYVRPGVYGFPLRPPEYIAIVMSQDRRWSMWQYEALAHEGGHAVWWRFLDPASAASPVMWDPPSPWFEGFAQFFERLVYDPGFSARYVPDLPADLRQPLADWRARKMPEWITDSIVQTEVEKRLYADPTSLDAIARYAAETRARLTGAPMPPSSEDGLTYDPALISSILLQYPAYSQNYLFAYLTEAWLYEAVTAQVGDPIANAQVGPLLRDKLVRGDPATTLPDRIAALYDGERTEALRKYLKGPAAPPRDQ